MTTVLFQDQFSTPDWIELTKSSNPANSRLCNCWRDLVLRINRGDWTPLELFVADLHGLSAAIRTLLFQAATG